MSAIILDGHARAQKIRDSLKDEVAKIEMDTGAMPYLVNIIIGEDAGSHIYSKAPNHNHLLAGPFLSEERPTGQ